MNTLLEMTGMQCQDLSEDGSIWLISTDHTFADGDYISVYAEKLGEKIRFFDDYEVTNHLDGRGYPVHNKRRMKPLWSEIEKDGVTVNEDGGIEIIGSADNAPELFSKFIAAMIHVVDWEKDREKIPDEIVSLSDEVYHYLSLWKPGHTSKARTDITGISGNKYTFEYTFDGRPVLTTKSHANAIASVIKRLVDMKSNPDSNTEPLVVVDDCSDSGANKDIRILQAVAKTMKLSRLKKNSAEVATVH